MPTDIVMTDPARELAELCEALRSGVSPSDISGEGHLAKKFLVEPWSLAFFEIIFTIMQRIQDVAAIIATLEMDDDYQSELIEHVEDIGSAFTAQAMRNQWASIAATHVDRKNIQPLKGVASQVRQHISYKKLSQDEIDSILNDAESLKTWLDDANLQHNDFIRQAMVEAIDKLVFRLERLHWVGWGYTLESLREVIAAYVVLEQSGVSPEVNPDAEAVLRRVGALIKDVYTKVQPVKAAAETADWLIKAYGVGALIYQGKPIVTALIGSG